MEKYSYITLLTNDTYVYGVILLNQTLKQVKTKYPLLVLITNNVSDASKEILTQLNIKYRQVDNIPMSDELFTYNSNVNARFAAIWKNCFTKLHIFELEEFTKIIFLDADIMVLKNLDHLFKKPHMTAALDGEYFNIWPDWPHFNSGCLVIEPSIQEFNNILDYINNFDVNIAHEGVIADQEILNLYYNNWPNQTNLHLNKYYNIFAPYIPEEKVEDVNKNAYFIHFIGRKPWTFWVKNSNENYSEDAYEKAKDIIVRAIQNIDWDKIRSKLKLTSYAICKNEVDNVEKWLKGFGQADYVCVLDTGSTDGTWEKLQECQKQYPNLIIKQKIINPWRFDVARNESMKLIPQDSVIQFMADLDEEIRTENWVQLIKDKWDPMFSRGMYNYHRDVGPGDIIQRTIKEYRIHSREWTHWENIVHECLVTDAEERRFYQDTCTEINIEVWHFPKSTKEVDYSELCEEDLKEHPENSLMELQLAIEYQIREQNDLALKHFQNLIDHPGTLQLFEVARCFSGAGEIYQKTGNIDLAKNLYREGRLLDASFSDNYMRAVELYFNEQNYNAAITLCKEALKNCPEAYWCSIYDMNAYYVYKILGLSYYLINNKELSICYLTIANQKNFENEIQQIINQAIIELTQQRS